MSLSMKIKRSLNDFSESSFHYVMELILENNEKNMWLNSDKDEVENPRSGEQSIVLLIVDRYNFFFPVHNLFLSFQEKERKASRRERKQENWKDKFAGEKFTRWKKRNRHRRIRQATEEK